MGQISLNIFKYLYTYKRKSKVLGRNTNDALSLINNASLIDNAALNDNVSLIDNLSLSVNFVDITDLDYIKQSLLLVKKITGTKLVIIRSGEFIASNKIRKGTIVSCISTVSKSDSYVYSYMVRVLCILWPKRFQLIGIHLNSHGKCRIQLEKYAKFFTSYNRDFFGKKFKCPADPCKILLVIEITFNNIDCVDYFLDNLEPVVE